MLYEGKYSLSKNLLSEAIEVPQPDGTIKYRSGPTGQRLYDTAEEAEAAAAKGAKSAQTGKVSQGALKDVIEANGGVVHSVASSNEGADLVVTMNGTMVNLELGVEGKTTQLGFYYPNNLDDRHGWLEYNSKKPETTAKQDAFIAAFGSEFKPGMPLDGDAYMAYWKASGDDVIVYGESRTGPFVGLAVTAKGKAAFPQLDMMTADHFGRGTITGSGQGRAPKADGTPGEKRYGFRAFGSRSGATISKLKPLF